MGIEQMATCLPEENITDKLLYNIGGMEKPIVGIL